MSDKFFTNDIELNEEQTEQLIEILSKRCRVKTWNRLRSILTYDLSTVMQDIYWMKRFYLDHKGAVHYCAGQSYPCEIRAIRTEILKKYP